MADVLQLKSLSVLEGVEQNLRTLNEIISFIKNLVTPQDIVDKSSDIIKSLNEMDMSFSIISTDLNQLRVIHKETLDQYKNLHSELLSKINARREKQIQLNSNVELYNSERLMNTLQFSNDGVYVSIQEESKPEEYSILNIINKIEKSEPLVLENIGNYLEYHEGVGSNRFGKIPVVKSMILSLKSLFDSAEFIQIMSSNIYTTECKDYIYKVSGKISVIVKWMEWVREYMKGAFRMFVAMKENYAIYSDAVDKFSNIALESLFNPNSYYEVL